MATRGRGEDDDTPTVWQGYANFKQVSKRMAMSIEDAVDAYSALRALHAEGARVQPSKAANARRHIRASAMRLRVELEKDEDEKDVYAEILTRWDEGEGGEDGFFDRLDEVSLTNRCPDWLDQFVADIRKAGWELGYLQSGKTVRAEEGDVTERQATSILQE